MSRFTETFRKAQQNRQSDDQDFFIDDKRQLGPLQPSLEAPHKALSDIEVSYTETKIQDIDPRVLIKNRVFSQYQTNGLTDHFNLLRLQVLNKLEEIGGNSLLITSTHPSEGKTFTAINLGICLAQELARTVLLVDADLKTPTHRHYDFAHDFFSIKAGKGLADYLLGQAEIPEVLLNPGIQKLTILPAGRTLPNSAELLGSARMVALVEEMKLRYPDDRVVIFDTPSLLCTDPLVLSRYVDGVLLIIEQDKTTARELHRTIELLKDCKILGTVLNKSKSGKTAYI